MPLVPSLDGQGGDAYTVVACGTSRLVRLGHQRVAQYQNRIIGLKVRAAGETHEEPVGRIRVDMRERPPERGEHAAGQHVTGLAAERAAGGEHVGQLRRLVDERDDFPARGFQIVLCGGFHAQLVGQIYGARQ